MLDFRNSFKSLRRASGFTALVGATLALCIGSVTAVFSFLNGVVLRPLALGVADQDQMVALCAAHESVAGFCVASPADATDWSTQSRTLAGIGISRSEPFTLQIDDDVTGVDGALVTPGFFRIFNVEAELGRIFDEQDDQLGRDQVVILSHGFWQGRLGGEKEVLGESLIINKKSYTVIGVLPQGLEIPRYKETQLWMPLVVELNDIQMREWRGFLVVGRLHAGATLRDAQIEIRTVASRLAEEYPESNKGWSVNVVPLHELIVGSMRSILLIFQAAVILVLLVGCANVANLVLVRAIKRRREFAVRGALGARWGQLVRQLFSESFLLAMLGGAGGLALAALAVRTFVTVAPPGVPRLDAVTIDGTVFFFVLLTTVATSIVFGFAPAIQAAKVNLIEDLRGGMSAHHGRLVGSRRDLLVVAEVALALNLLIGAGLLIRSYSLAADWQSGFDQHNLLTVWLLGPAGKYPETHPGAFFDQIARELSTLPGVTAVGATSAGPLFGSRETGEFVIEGREEDDPQVARWFDVDEAYFRTLGVSLREGRYFGSADNWNALRTAIVNEAMANRLWPASSPLGKRVRGVHYPPWMEVVGVVKNLEPFPPGSEAEPEIYWSKLQDPRWATYLLFRTSSDPQVLVGSIRRRLRELEPDLDARRFATFEELLDRQLARPRFSMLLLTFFAFVALVLAIGGTYAVISHNVAHRTREIGLRVALGARRHDILRWILKSWLLVTGSGVILGLIGSVGLTKAISPMLSGIEPTDPLTFLVMIAIMLIVSVLSCLRPAISASAIAPMEAMRHE